MGFWKNRPLIIAVICSILLFVLLLSTSGSTQSSGAGSAMSRLLVPVQRFLYSSTETVSYTHLDVYKRQEQHKHNEIDCSNGQCTG